MKLIADAMAIFEEYLCFEHCRACGRHCRAHAGNYGRVKAICDLCWSRICAETPVSQHKTTSHGQNLRIVSAVAYEGPVKRFIYQLKYDADLLLVRDLAQLLMNPWSLLREDEDLGSMILVPIPLHPKRLKSRGFNQSEFLAEDLARLANVVVDPLALKRIKNTEAQHGLGRVERQLNLAGAFRGDSAKLTGRTVILIDDIYTSGATLAEAAQEVLSCGANLVMAMTVAWVE